MYVIGLIASLALVLFLGTSTTAGAVTSGACPVEAVAIVPGSSIQEAVRKASPGAVFCIKSGVHRLQEVIPKAMQKFYGEEGAVLSGAAPLATFRREGRFWIAEGQHQRPVVRGTCYRPALPCRTPAGFYIDGVPLRQVSRKEDVETGSFFFDFPNSRIYFADDPSAHQVEAAVAQYAFVGSAPDVLFQHLIVEKYNNPAQEGAIHGKAAKGWHMEDCEFRMNLGAGAAVGPGGVVRASVIHDNGQLGIAATGNDIIIENNRIYANNTLGFDPSWDAGGVKTTVGHVVVMRGNEVYDNHGPGLWCDIDCRDVVIENNIVRDNDDAGIFYEISSRAKIVRNVVSRNGRTPHTWVWKAEIQVAASEEVEVAENDVRVAPFGHGIMLIDQGRRLADRGAILKTQKNVIRDNVVRFEGVGRTGGTSDVSLGSENGHIIESGGNVLLRNTYIAERSAPRFLWGHDEMPFEELERRGQEIGSVLRFR